MAGSKKVYVVGYPNSRSSIVCDTPPEPLPEGMMMVEVDPDVLDSIDGVPIVATDRLIEGPFLSCIYSGVGGGGSSQPTVDPDVLRDAKIDALSERNAFLEDCIAEMASLIYN